MPIDEEKLVKDLVELVKISVEAERQRCIEICEGWIGTFQDKEIKFTSPREYAIDAIEDIIDLIRDGHDPATLEQGQKQP